MKYKIVQAWAGSMFLLSILWGGKPVLADDIKCNWHTRLQSLPERQHLGFFTTVLQQEVANVLGLPTNELPDPQLLFADLGFDSLRVIELITFLENQMETSISSTAIMEHPTIAALAEHLTDIMQQSPNANDTQ